MTTIAANLKEIAADTRVSWEGIGSDVFTAVKLFSVRNAIYGITGENCDGSLLAIEWLQRGATPTDRPCCGADSDWKLIELSAAGLAIYNTSLEREVSLDACLAVGSGRKVALYCMRFCGMSPAQAVAEACKVDSWSAPPIYVASLARPTVRRWAPPPKKRKAKK